MMSREERIALNMRQICLHEAKPNIKPMSSTTVTRGFEKVAFPKIVRELQDADLVVRQKALLAARELLGSPINYVQCIAAGITPAVIALLKDKDALVRERAAGTAEYIAVKEVGARDIIQHGGVYQLVACLTDTVMAVRDAAYKALIEAARFNSIRKELCDEGALVELMALVLQEDHSRALQGLVLLNACVQVLNNDESLKQLIDHAGSIEALVRLIGDDQPADIQQQAAQLLGVLTSRLEEAKVDAVKDGAVPKLLDLLSSDKIHLASAAATALMTITISRDGKYAVIHTSGGLETLVAKLDRVHEQLCVNLMEVITNVAEAPEARPVLAEAGVQAALTHIHDASTSEVLKRSSAQALRQCGFKHLPYDVLRGRQLEK